MWQLVFSQVTLEMYFELLIIKHFDAKVFSLCFWIFLENDKLCFFFLFFFLSSVSLTSTEREGEREGMRDHCYDASDNRN